MELYGAGPVVFIDTPGIDDIGDLGKARAKRALQVLRKTDIAVIVVDPIPGFGLAEKNLLNQLMSKSMPVIAVVGKQDIWTDKTCLEKVAGQVKAVYRDFAASGGKRIPEHWACGVSKMCIRDRVSIGPFIPHPDTPLGTAGANTKTSNPTGLIRATLRAMALSRLMMPLSHIPATTALGVIGRNSREWVELWKQNPKHHDTLSWFDPAQEWNDPRGLALLCGANVIMPDVTPKRFRDSYEIYPGKASSDGEELAAIVKAVNLLIDGLGMFVAPGRGDSPKPGFRHCAFEYTGHNDVTERTDQK